MLLDEPFSGLDKRLRDQIRDETLHVLKANRVATLMVTHDPEEAMFMADRIAVMRGGRIIQLDCRAALYNAPADPFVASFFGEVNVLAAPVRAGAGHTPLGRFAAPGLAEGAAAELVVRPEAITVRPAADGVAVVRTARLLGRTSLLHLSVGAPGFAPCHLHCRLGGGPVPEEGSRVALALDPTQVFVFPASD